MSGWELLPGRGSLRGMTMSSNPYRGFRFPPEVIQHAVWLYLCFSLNLCFSLSLRDVELILAAWDRRQLREYQRVGPALRPDLRQYADAADAVRGPLLGF